MVKAACDDVLLNSLTIRGSAKLHSVPESTLRKRLGGSRVLRNGKWVHQHILQCLKNPSLHNTTLIWQIMGMVTVNGKSWN